MEPSPRQARASEAGVYFRREDYAGFWRRLAIELIDGFIAGNLWIALFFILYSYLPSEFTTSRQGQNWLRAGSFVVVGLGYFVLLRRSRLRTVGYRLFRVRIINLQGDRPDIFALAIRLVFSVFGPGNLLLDRFWIPSERARQALRDKFAHTYVIKADAVPVGRGPIVYAQYHFNAMTHLFPEVLPSHESRTF